MSNKYTIEELLEKELIFIDLEANQDVNNTHIDVPNNHYLLELSGIKSLNGKEISRFDQKVFQYKPLNKQVASLLNKHVNYYNNHSFLKEKKVYQLFQEFSKDAIVVTYGNYDQTVLDSVAKRWGLERIELFDACEEIKKGLKIDKQHSPSLSSLAYSFDIDQSQYNKHEAFEDARLLFDIFLAFLKSDHSKLGSIREKLMNEFLRPGHYKEYIKKPNKFEISIEPDYLYILDLSEIRKHIERDEITEKVINIHYSYYLDIRIINQEGKMINRFYQNWTTCDYESIANQLIQDCRARTINKYGIGNVFISKNKFKTAYSNILINKFNKRLPLVFTDSLITIKYVLKFNEITDDIIKTIIEKINCFYDPVKKDFSKINKDS